MAHSDCREYWLLGVVWKAPCCDWYFREALPTRVQSREILGRAHMTELKLFPFYHWSMNYLPEIAPCSWDILSVQADLPLLPEALTVENWKEIRYVTLFKSELERVAITPLTFISDANNIANPRTQCIQPNTKELVMKVRRQFPEFLGPHSGAR